MKAGSEATFERQLISLAPLAKCYVCDIPDEIITKERRETKIIARRRPFDIVLFTNSKAVVLELKVGSNRQSYHQKITEERINEINKSYFVVRRRNVKTGEVYTIEQNQNVLFKTDDILRLFEFFKEKA